MRAVVFDLSIPKYIAAKAFGKAIPALYDGAPSCLSFSYDVPAPELPGDDWVKLQPIATGVCGSDLAFVYFKSSPTLSPYGTYPFVPGHEILAYVLQTGSKVKNVKEGDRVVVDPWMNCDVRGVTPCMHCAQGSYEVCSLHAVGPKKGMLIGVCADLPGGWCEQLVAHQSQLFRLPDSVNDVRGVLMEPLAVAVHAVLRNLPQPGEQVLVLGGGPIAFSIVFALKELAHDCDLTLFTIEQDQAGIAEELGVDRAWTPGQEALVDRAAQLTRAPILKPELGPRYLADGFDRIFDCVGNAASIRDAMGLCGARGTIVMVGNAGKISKVDLSHLWSKEITWVGTLGYSYEDFRGQRRRTFDITREIVGSSQKPIEKLVTHSFPLEQYREALRVNLDRSATGAIKAVLTP